MKMIHAFLLVVAIALASVSVSFAQGDDGDLRGSPTKTEITTPASVYFHSYSQDFVNTQNFVMITYPAGAARPTLQDALHAVFTFICEKPLYPDPGNESCDNYENNRIRWFSNRLRNLIAVPLRC